MRADIEKYLGTVHQSTARVIAQRIGLDPVDVVKELNRMLGDGLVEREKRQGAGNEFYWWLSRGDMRRTPAPMAVHVEAAQKSVPTPSPAAEPAAVHADGAFAKLADRTAELLKVLGLPPTLTEAIDAARDMIEIAKQTAVERDELRVERESLLAANARLKANNAHLEKRLDDLTIGPVGAKSPLFVTLGRNCTPKRHTSLDKAQKRGQSLVRAEKESEVLVLEPVGRIVRGSEWRPQ